MKEKYLTWEEMKALAMKHYNHGGDGIVECWDEEVYNEVGPFTEAEALRYFKVSDSVTRDIEYTAWG